MVNSHSSGNVFTYRQSHLHRGAQLQIQFALRMLHESDKVYSLFHVHDSVRQNTLSYIHSSFHIYRIYLNSV